MTRSAKVRALVVCCALALCFTGFSYRLIVLQVRRHAQYAALAEKSHIIRQTIHARRGLIRDINYETLAENDPICTVIADGLLIKNAAATAEVLAGPLELKEAELRAKLMTKSRYVVIKKQVPKSVASAIENRL